MAQNRRRGWQNFEKKTGEALAETVFFEILSPSEPILRAKIENMISPDYVLCYIVRFLESFENLETKAIFRILRIFFSKKMVNHGVVGWILLSKFSIFPPQFLRKWAIPVTGSDHKCFAKFVAIFAFDTFFGGLFIHFLLNRILIRCWNEYFCFILYYIIMIKIIKRN